MVPGKICGTTLLPITGLACKSDETWIDAWLI